LKYFVEVIKPVDLTVPEQQELGYMALRDDFERVCKKLHISFVCAYIIMVIIIKFI